MKRVLLASFLLISAAAQAQLTLEHTYQDASVYSFKLSTGQVKFAIYSQTDSKLYVYNADHSLLRQIPVPPVPATSSYGDILDVSDKLFNLTPDIECAIALYNGATQQNSVYVLSETGAQLLTVASGSYAQAVNTSTGSKLLVYGSFGTRVYAAPGTYTPLKTAKSTDGPTASPFPNPAAERITLPYSVQPGTLATLEVLDLAGRVVKTFQVNAAFNHLLLDARELRPGAYTYRVVTAAGSSSAGKRFIVAR
ncbi:T9SS type A sorting domain-containing protein [Hymenobacter persicinus]|uniref:T9SS type A sorting domain-containing protein n=1 Tax=Hymenobacter persicinus TaxID=2025506 RepID=A0A4Q5LFF3_9BACT|nr:T9SS type A sorting domain-containing protein [Hymenobacter persicinus]RYU79553.1 T9SS type A sorting domain-containing protein [Hymenobacter persicinus]